MDLVPTKFIPVWEFIDNKRVTTNRLGALLIQPQDITVSKFFPLDM
jgi:hypothetical protein